MANHKWDNPNSLIYATCIKCGIERFCLSSRFGRWEYRLITEQVFTTFERPTCIKRTTF